MVTIGLSLPFPGKGLRDSPAQDNAQALDYVGITLLSVSYAEIRMTITDRNAGYDGLKGELANSFLVSLCELIGC